LSADSLFNILGPVMVGPSSSHTAGAVRLASLARLIAGSRPGNRIREAEFILYNSFAQTYEGHGTDKGLLAGLLGLGVDDERIRDALALADEAGLSYRFTPYHRENHYSPNTVGFVLHLEHGETLRIVGHSVGGGKVYISKINDQNVTLRGELPTLLVWYKDQPGMIWQVTKVIAENHVNIAALTCNRTHRGEDAFMSITLDSLPSAENVAAIQQVPDVYAVRCFDALSP